MKLIRISSNVMVNPECISCIEQKTVNGIGLIMVRVGDDYYPLDIPLEDLLEQLEEEVPEPGQQQYFAG